MSSLDDLVDFNKEFATSGSTSEGGGPMHYNDTYGGRHPDKKKKHIRVLNKLMKDDDTSYEKPMPPALRQLQRLRESLPTDQQRQRDEANAAKMKAAAKTFKETQGLTDIQNIEDPDPDDLEPTPETVMVSANTADKAFEGQAKKKLKDSSGIERVGKWLEDNSPAMGVNKAYGETRTGVNNVSPNKRRLLPNTSMGTSGFGGSTYNDNSHSVTLAEDGSSNSPKKTTLVGKDDGRKSTIVLSTDSLTDLVKWVTVELRKDNPDPYDIERNSERTKPMRSGDQNIKSKTNNSPTTETTVPKEPSTQFPNMGQAGGLEASEEMHDPEGAEGQNSNANAVNLPEPGRIVRRKNEDPTQKGAYLASPNQMGMNVMGMEKGLAGGGTPHMHSIVQPIHGGEKAQTKPYIEGESNLETNNVIDPVEERMKEKSKRDRKDAEPGMDGPSIDDAGAGMASYDNPISQYMEKQGYDYEADALHRGGTQDKDNYNELDDEDEGWEDAAIEEDVRREIAKGAQSFYQGILDGTITKDTFGRFE